MKTVLIVGGAAIGALLLWKYAAASSGSSSSSGASSGASVPGGSTMTPQGQASTTTGAVRPLGGIQSVFSPTGASWRPGALPPSSYTPAGTPQLSAGWSSSQPSVPTSTNAATQSTPSAPESSPGTVQPLGGIVSRPWMVLR